MQKNIVKQIISLILSDLPLAEIEKKLDDYHDSDIAEALQGVSKEIRFKIYDLLGEEKTADIFSYYDRVEDFIEELDPEQAADIIEEMDSDDAMDILNELEEESKSEIIELMEEESQSRVRQIDAYEEDEIGSYISDNYIIINKNYTVPQAMSTLVSQAGEHDNIATLYVIDEESKYCGAITLRDLIVARKEDILWDLCMESYPFFYDSEKMSECILRIKNYAEESFPVLNATKTIVGVINAETIMDVVDEESKEDFAKFAGLSDSEDIDETTFSSIKKRIPWLIILLFLGFIVATVIGSFEGVIATLPAIVFFQSTILDMAGNVGTQSLAVTIRNISDGKMNKKDIRRTILKETRVSFINGLILGVIAFIFVIVFLAIRHQAIIIEDGYVFTDTVIVGGIISISLVFAMTLSGFVGTVFPLTLNKVGVDPAVASGPFITTINDVIAVLVYYGLTYILFISVL